MKEELRSMMTKLENEDEDITSFHKLQISYAQQLGLIDNERLDDVQREKLQEYEKNVHDSMNKTL